MKVVNLKKIVEDLERTTAAAVEEEGISCVDVSMCGIQCGLSLENSDVWGITQKTHVEQEREDGQN